MSPSEQNKCIGEAVNERKDARHALGKARCLVRDMGRRLVDLGQQLEHYTHGDMTKEDADGRLTIRRQGLIQIAVSYPLEQDILEAVTECDRLTKQIDRLTQIIGE